MNPGRREDREREGNCIYASSECVEVLDAMNDNLAKLNIST